MKRIIEFFSRETMLVNFIIILVTLAGIFSFFNVNREIFPNVSNEMLFINVVYPGASPTDVELNTIVPIEEILKEINGIKKYSSASMQDKGFIMITIDDEVDDIEGVKDEIYRKVSKNTIEDLPDEVDDVMVTERNSELIPVYIFSISPKKGLNVTDRELYDTSELMDNLITRVAGVSHVEKAGYREREIHINVDPEKMTSQHISLAEVISAIQQRNVRQAGGTYRSVSREETVLTIGQFQNPKEVGNVIIRSGFEQSVITVNNIATIADTLKDEEQRLKINNRTGVVLIIKKKGTADIIKTVDKIKKFLEKNKSLYNDRFDLTLVEDNADSVQSLIDVVVNNAVIGFFLVFLILVIFLDLKTSFWTAFSIPVCLFVVVTYMMATGTSLNLISLGAFITVLGMLVDDAIVIAENIFEKRQQGLPVTEAAVEGVLEVAGPVAVTILSTIVAFLPMLAINGMMGKFISVYPIIITITLGASLFEAFFLLPNHLIHGWQPKKVRSTGWFERLKKVYASALRRVLRFRYLVVALFISLLIISVAVSRDTISNFVLFWNDSGDEITVNLEGPTGSTLDSMEKLTSRVEKKVRQVMPAEKVISVFTTIGTYGGDHMKMDRDYPHFSNIVVKLIPSTERKESIDDYIMLLQKKLKPKDFRDLKVIDIQENKHGPQPGSAVDIKIITNNMSHAAAAEKEITGFLNSLEGVEGIDSDNKRGKDELVLKFNYRRMAQYGITVATVADTVRTAYEGNKSTYVQTTDDKLYFRVRIDRKKLQQRSMLLNLLIKNETGNMVRLGDIATFKRQPGTASIKHYNSIRATSITASLDESVTTSRLVNRAIAEKFLDITSKYPGLYLVFGGEREETGKALSGLAFAFLMALLCIYFMVAFLFRSTLQPFIVISVIPFGIIGVLLAFTAHGIPLSFMAIIGIIGLSGIVVNDSILMVTFINRQVLSIRDSPGREIIKKIAEGAGERLRPILLTTITTVGALMPTVYGIGGSSSSIIPTVMAMSYGLLFGTLLTLFLIPSVYMIMRDITGFGKKRS